MSHKLNRRTFLAGTVAGTAAATLRFPAPAIAQGVPFKIGLLAVKTGPLAQGGIQMEQGIAAFLKEKNHTLAGRKIELLVADTGGNPAGAKTKAQEVIERDKVNGPRRKRSSSATRSTSSWVHSPPSSCWRSPTTYATTPRRC